MQLIILLQNDCMFLCTHTYVDVHGFECVIQYTVYTRNSTVLQTGHVAIIVPIAYKMTGLMDEDINDLMNCSYIMMII